MLPEWADTVEPSVHCSEESYENTLPEQHRSSGDAALLMTPSCSLHTIQEWFEPEASGCAFDTHLF